jgi:hypothetical protein
MEGGVCEYRVEAGLEPKLLTVHYNGLNRPLTCGPKLRRARIHPVDMATRKSNLLGKRAIATAEI